MIVIALIAAFCLYVGLYMVWVTAQPHVNKSLSMIDIIVQMLFVPQHTVFFILRSLIFITFAYVIADFFYSSGRRAMKRRSAKSKSANTVSQQAKS